MKQVWNDNLEARRFIFNNDTIKEAWKFDTYIIIIKDILGAYKANEDTGTNKIGIPLLKSFRTRKIKGGNMVFDCEISEEFVEQIRELKLLKHEQKIIENIKDDISAADPVQTNTKTTHDNVVNVEPITDTRYLLDNRHYRERLKSMWLTDEQLKIAMHLFVQHDPQVEESLKYRLSAVHKISQKIKNVLLSTPSMTDTTLQVIQ